MNKQFSARLEKAVRSTGLIPTHFAKKAGVPQGTISKCLHGHVPTARLLLRISKASGKSVEWLLTGKERGVVGGGYVAEKAASYGRRGRAKGAQASEEIWVSKLLMVLRSGSGRKVRKIKDTLNSLTR